MQDKNYWHFEGQDKPKDNFITKYLRKKFFNNKVGLAQATISKEVYRRFINKNTDEVSFLDIGGAGGHQFDDMPIKDKTRIDIDGDKLKESKDWKVIKMDAHSLDFEYRSFNLISCFQVLEHTKNPLEIMNEMYRVLKPGGKIWITVPDLHGVGFSFYDYYTHIFPFTKKRLEFMIKSCGFKNIVIKRYSIPKYWFVLKLFPKILVDYMFRFKRGVLLCIATKDGEING